MSTINSNKQQWCVINELLGKKTSIKIPKLPLKNDKEITNYTQLANTFNLYFSNIGCRLAKLIPTTTINHLDYMDPPVDQSLFLEPVVIQEIITIFNNIKTNAAGTDHISKNMIKYKYHTLANHIIHIINCSFSEGVVPKELKIAKVNPFFKSGDKDILGNYRPVAILPLFSKVWEKLFYDRLLKFLTNNNVLYNYQYGFRKKHSTEYAVMALQNYVNNAFERGEYVVGIFLDLSKAFDTLNKDILLNKLHRYGIRGTPNKWIRSYLTGRSQQTILTSKDILSDNSRIDIGVPQGSILGPILFLIYINDLPNFNKEVFTLMFADDSSLFLSGPNLDELMLKVKKAIIEVKAWIDTNKLSLNLGKTKYMIFTKREIIRKYDYISMSRSISCMTGIRHDRHDKSCGPIDFTHCPSDHNELCHF